MNINDIKTLINEVSSSNLHEFRYEENGVKVQLSKGAIESGNNKSIITATSQPKSQYLESESPEAEAETKSESQKEEAPGNIVTAPLVGTVYLAPAENEPPFVSIGDKVEKGQPLAIIEAMKLMNEIESKYDGVVKDILVENESPVEFGQEMFVIE
ncbi:acetyl-CoA carboxylase biotin carboxyl carrier protein [uncultured Eubacterium sp.]|uniref:acetyl-CoA carboxylase biotin carboxyl carrier protein n=1 Tax=Eubacterium sp. TaxID=142586 RepID=UPI0026727201|nr:acetyl-CoA carboxylase biotin carboxyl carrier protein [uncultured Eubacterium sp.]